VVALVSAVTFIRGLFWLLDGPSSTGDEVAHFSYIQWIATGRGLPIVGQARATATGLVLAKASPIEPWRGFPLPPVPSAHWPLVGLQYEAYQTPGYHILMVPAYWIGRAAGGALGALYAIRLETLLCLVAAIPVTFLLGRELVPHRRAVALLAPAVLASIPLFDSGSTITNDSITPLAGAGALLIVLRFRHHPTTRWATITGVTLALALLAKTTLTALVPAVGVAVAFYLVTAAVPWRTIARWVGGAAVGGAPLMLAWLAWNLHAYGALSGGRAQAELVVKSLGSTPPGLAGMRKMLHSAARSLFVAGHGGTAQPLVHRVWYDLATVGLAAALIGAVLAADRMERYLVSWLFVTVPMGVVLLAAANLQQSGPGAELSGRHLDCLLPVFCIVVAYGVVSVAGARGGTTLLLAALVFTAFAEIPADDNNNRSTYTAGLIGPSAAVVTQSYTDGAEATRRIEMRSPCPPTWISVRLHEAIVSARLNGQPIEVTKSNAGWNYYPVSNVASGPLDMVFDGTADIGVANHGHDRDVNPLPGGAVPSVQIYCRVANPVVYQFRVDYRPDHPFPMTYRVLADWPRMEAYLELAAALVAVGLIWIGPYRVRRRTSSAPDPGPVTAP
jgi:hypothetical protein